MEDELIDQVVDELMQGFETKDKGMIKEALRAFVLHIQDEDQEQDAGEMS